MASNTVTPSFSARNNCLTAISSLVVTVLVALTVQIFYFSPIDPLVLDIEPASSIKNNKLQNIIKLGEGILKEPEDVCVDKEGIVYTATRDGWIKRLRRNGNWENWKHIESETLLGITGLLKVTEEDGFSVLVSEVNGSQLRLESHTNNSYADCFYVLFCSFVPPTAGLLYTCKVTILRFADDVIEASDGNIYFSIASTKFDLQHCFLDFLEARPHGKLLKYIPTSNETVIILDDLTFPNGVALSKDEDYLVTCETWKCLRHWLKGENKGTTDIFIENLPGGPDNINLAPDGSFWIALLTSEGLEFVHYSKITKHLLASFPRLFKLVTGVKKKAMVVNVATNGKIIRKFDDDDGKVITFVTSAMEFEDHLYLGSLNSNFIGKLPLHSA
ncbi:hypothetical protein VNO77_22924 [Canavalia gladiata]|uniref:Strictosidine synthase conserved region domain-containing protein n=1 Tax=Canavalia gladiata TaxID=3824 RepID=A0AAN9L4E8_CANGL